VSDGYQILSLDELETVPYRGSNLVPVRHTLGFQPAGVNAWRADTGGQLIPPHTEDSGSEELYAVVRGRASFTVGEEEAEAPAGTLVFVPAEVFRTAVAAEDDTIVFVVGGWVGEAFTSAGWDEGAA
jgi:oxalate decarboxylase/phosphoglucose isomerase-like protein (cupin superfamily)